ncbi:cytochrome c oxidase subunit II [Aureispira sp. CCB-E]|uniref:cytochrome c oxidase subunit II n=1 Tax=Aureispira sp. CCB-E TaxID=3051121 RepID=UPI002868F1DD|nr:cytochrome c oxidase subunit II [Aureispira sp. CCB-E]WMX15659.1 cytochrome c oxidase subunit II [Aureispira sp. CCB-E]
MGFTIGALCVILLAVFIVQVGKARELASIVRNDPAEQDEINKFHTGLGMVFMVTFLSVCVVSFIYYIPTTLGWGPNIAASKHGPEVDYLFNLTLFFTFIVFVLTHIALFWFAWKYKGKQGKIGLYWAHNETLEMVWMIIPSVVMTFLVVGGLQAWNKIMLDLPEDSVSVILPEEDGEYLEIEATGTQFLWYLRYPGRDGKIGTKYFTQINSANQLGQTWTDEKNMDDFMTTEIVLPVGKPVRVRITARDVLHNFYIRDMRVKTDAVPGMPTYFNFTPTVTTDSMRRRLSQQPEWQVPDKKDDTKQRWEMFNYELACAELCGNGHYSMRNLVKIVSEEEYLDWLDEQEGGKLEEVVDSANGGETTYTYVPGSVKSQYFSKIFNTDKDPLKGKTADLEKLVENKLRVNVYMNKMREMRNNAELGSADYNNAEAAMNQLKPIQKVARTTTSVAESNAKLEEAKAIANSVKITPKEPVSVSVDSTVQDTTGK